MEESCELYNTRHIGDLQKPEGKNAASTWGQVLDFSEVAMKCKKLSKKGSE